MAIENARRDIHEFNAFCDAQRQGAVAAMPYNHREKSYPNIKSSKLWMKALLSCLIFMLVSSVSAETITCENSLVSVNYREVEHAEIVCKTVGKATALFGQCNMPPLSQAIRIEIVEELEDGCVGLYHCGQNWIEVLEPQLMASKRDPESAFGFLQINNYFQSAIVHELAHAVSDYNPCPFEACLVRDEYIAYAMQVMSLSSDQRLKFTANAGLNRPISRDELSPMSLFAAPNIFAQKVWTHLSQRENPCEFIGQLNEGKVLLDRERF